MRVLVEDDAKTDSRFRVVLRQGRASLVQAPSAGDAGTADMIPMEAAKTGTLEAAGPRCHQLRVIPQPSTMRET